MRRKVMVVLALLCVACLGGLQAQEKPPEELALPEDPLQVQVQRFIAAFNGHSSSEMALLAAAEIEVYYVDTNGKATLGTDGRSTLASEMSAYFQSFPDVHSEPEGWAVAGRFVAFTEVVSWTRNGARVSQRSLAVYELEAGLVRRVWYYPSSE